MRFYKKHKIFTLVLAVIAIVLLYCAGIMVKAYVDTPAVISKALASCKMALNVDDLTPEFQEILLKVEDPNFYSHKGVDLSTPGAGQTSITQGLVKILYFDGYKPGVAAKLKQSLIALVLNRRVDKATQLRLFINSVYLGTIAGKDVIGLNDGAETYFKKNFGSLSKDEYLALVAMIVAPNDLSIATQPEKNAERVRRIKRMLNGDCQPANHNDIYYANCQ